MKLHLALVSNTVVLVAYLVYISTVVVLDSYIVCCVGNYLGVC
jgi:hypothetical protein